MHDGHPRPNPRLQRTPSAAPPSPLSRQPLGGRGFLAAVALTSIAATRTPSRPTPSVTPAVSPPVVKSSSIPDQKVLSEKCKGARPEGLPVVEAFIQEDGTVRDVRSVGSCGCSAGDQLLVDAIKKWTYKPAEKDGRPVGVWLTVSINHFWW